MDDYVFFTDTSCDLPGSILAEHDVRILKFEYTFDDGTPNNLSINAFYNAMRSGKIAKTSGIAPGVYSESFREVLKQGKDIFYLSFSSGLSTSYNSAKIAAEEFSEEFPERKIEIVDSLCASLGQGLLLYLLLMKKDKLNLTEMKDYAESIKLNICHWFTVDDLVYLKRGGRISQTSAVFGKLLGIKPIMHMDDNGKLVCVGKARGRRAAIKALAEKYGETTDDINNSVVFISHSDCNEDASMLAHELNLKFGVSVKIISHISPVIGAHCGPGTLAVFYLGRER